MAPRRRSCKTPQDQDESKMLCKSTMLVEKSATQSFRPQIVEDTRLGTSFEVDDFQEWLSSSADGTDRSIDSSIDPAIHPFLHFPDEVPASQATLQGIYPDPPSAAAKNSRRRSCSDAVRNQALGVQKSNASGKGISPRESHILSERQRRKGMNHLFTTLSSLLPESSSKSDKTTIVSEIISYIQSLQGDLEDLSKKRSEILQSRKTVLNVQKQTDSGSPSSQSNCTSNNDYPTNEQATMHSSLAANVILSICGNDAFITMSSTKKESLFSRALMILQQHKLQLVDATVSTSGCMIFQYFHARASDGPQVSRDALQSSLQNLTMDALASSSSVSG